MDVIQIMEILPHRYPMLLIDMIEENVAGRYAITKKNFSFNEPYIQGHYPGDPIVPGTVLLEALSQTASYTILTAENEQGGVLLFAGVDKLRFLQPVLPGDSIILRADVVRCRYGLWTVHGEGYDGDKMCISAEMTFMQKKGEA